MILGMFNRDGKKVAEFNPDDGVLMIPADDLRDKFAMAALSGLCAQFQINGMNHRSSDTAEKAYRLADAMMEARKS